MAKEYNLSKPNGICHACNSQVPPGQEIMAMLIETAEEFQRQDFCHACWPDKANPSRPEVVGSWKTRVPQPSEKKKLFVDDDLLINFFERLAETEDPAKINFRFVLALILMRKKMLVYEGVEKLDSGVELWKMRFKGTDVEHKVVDPKMDEEKISQVSQQLGEILEAQL